jgi:hypothetical protein
MIERIRRTGATRYALLLVLLHASVASQACDPRRVATDAAANALLKPPTPRDDFFYVVAVNFKVPQLCSRIEGRADARYVSSWAGFIQTMPSYCQRAIEGSAPSSVALPNPIDARFVEQVRAAGFGDTDVVQAAYAENNYLTPTHEAYLALLKDETFHRRLRAAKSFDEARDASRLRPGTPLEFMYQMVATDARQPALCARVSPNAIVDRGHEIAMLRTRCYLHAALSLRDERYCGELPTFGSFPNVNSLYDTPERCRESVAVYKKPEFDNQEIVEPYPFPRASDLGPILKQIGYADRELPQLPAVTPDDYWDFLSRLIFRSPAPERAEFIRRVTAMK